MGLFNKKPPCPICGGKIGWLFPSKIEGEYICDTCYGKMDIQDEIRNGLTMQHAREYFAFYEENCRLRDQFVISQKIDFGLWDTKMIFDFDHHWFCMSKHPDKTIFEAKHLRSFVIKEDNTPLFEGSANGIRRYQSRIPERAMALAPQLSQYVMNRRMMENMQRMADDEDKNRHEIPRMNIVEPFQNFNVELYMNHPYWNVIHCDMNGPRFSDTYPDANDYLREYEKDIKEIEILVNALREFAFPNAPDQGMGIGMGMNMGGMAFNQASPQMMQPPKDAIEEIRRYKTLLEEGLISEAEFQAKKRQLLDI